ncbi:hypothetical protein [Anaeromyxobacter sp. SG66]|uniref:hypothetical protein n=1 Tax=Anaeromyxobacter sp. SG66 TaxID=2925410 RepID=UPI001F582C4F|nr:hypothetical protein [Anaeromyxobacter sp. SG66]
MAKSIEELNAALALDDEIEQTRSRVLSGTLSAERQRLEQDRLALLTLKKLERAAAEAPADEQPASSAAHLRSPTAARARAAEIRGNPLYWSHPTPENRAMVANLRRELVEVDARGRDPDDGGEA